VGWGVARVSESSAAGWTDVRPEPDAPEDGYLTTVEVAHQSGATYRQIDYWTRSGLLRPVHQGGTGPARFWPPEEAEIAQRTARLVTAGLPLAWSAHFARNHWPAGELAPGITVSVTGEGP
jgi:hypothetical protein